MPIRDLNQSCADIAEVIRDYRAGEIPQPTQQHVQRWVDQFDAPDRAIVAMETAHLLKQLYVSKPSIERFVLALLRNQLIVGNDPPSFWQSVGLLQLQSGSQSQRDLVALLVEAIRSELHLNVGSSQSANATYFYLDDGVFTGKQVWTDLTKWIEERDIRDATIYIVVVAWHRSGQWFANKKLSPIAIERRIRMNWLRAFEIEDWRKTGNEANVQVLWPNAIPQDAAVEAWLARVPGDRTHFNPRGPGTANRHFSSEENRGTLELAFLKKGALIRGHYPNARPHMRPLGCLYLQGPGFGTMFATYRNCPNNCPLPLWWGLDVWYPLLPRRVRQQTDLHDLGI